MSNPSYKLKVISFKTCPFVQKVITFLEVKGISYEVEYIDLNNKPDWFYQVSPLGKVPVLVVDGQTLFESSVILDFLDEAYPPAWYPKDLVQKALNKAWIEYGSSLLFLLRRLLNSGDDRELKEECLQALAKLEQNILAAPFFNGNDFSVIDAAYTLVFMRLQQVQMYLKNGLDQFSKLNAWAQHVLSHPKVKRSLP